MELRGHSGPGSKAEDTGVETWGAPWKIWGKDLARAKVLRLNILGVFGEQAGQPRWS